jgi:hypothetical protein
MLNIQKHHIFYACCILAYIDHYVSTIHEESNFSVVAPQFDVPTEKVEEIKPNRPSKPSAPEPEVKRTRNADCTEDVPCTSA